MSCLLEDLCMEHPTINCSYTGDPGYADSVRETLDTDSKTVIAKNRNPGFQKRKTQTNSPIYHLIIIIINFVIMIATLYNYC